MIDVYTQILIYLIDHNTYPKPFSSESTFYEKELYIKFVSLLKLSEEKDDFSYQIEQMILVMSELGFLNKKRYEQYREISKLTSEYYLEDERYFYLMLFETTQNHSLSDNSKVFLYDHFGELMKKALVGISIREIQTISNEEIQRRLVYYLFESFGK